MPTSSYENMQIYLRAIRFFEKDIEKVLDVGVGFGKYGVIAREYLDVWQGRYPRRSWKTLIHGVEIYRKYRNPIHKYVYDKVYYKDITEFSWTMQTYDVISMVDAIEHLDKNAGETLLKRFLERVNLFVYLAFPDGHRDDALLQGAAFGNQHEAHVSRWTRDEFAGWDNALVISNTQVLLFADSACREQFAVNL